jgi:uncharacterized Zn-binding protein involved in type VI secretion
VAGEIIRLGDRTNHDGTVLEGSQVDICQGKPIAYIGHKVHCPKCKGDFPIVEGVVTTSFYGKGVAIAGMKTSCGAVLIPTQFTDIVEVGGGAAGAHPAAAPAAAVAAAAAGATAAPAAAQALATAAKDEAAPKDEAAKDKSVKRIYWSYGKDETPVDGASRHYVDLNLHVETENYAAGDSVDILLKNDDGAELVSGQQQLQLQAKVGADGRAKMMNVFNGKTVEIGMIG